MHNKIEVPYVHTHTESHRCEHNPYNTIRIAESVHDHLLVVPISTGVEHPEQPVVTNLLSTYWIVTSILKAVKKVSVERSTRLETGSKRAYSRP